MSKKRIGLYSFNLGIFLLASAPALSCVFILLASILGSTKRKDYFLSYKSNIFFSCAGLFMALNCFIKNYINLDISSSFKYLNFIGLINWLPFFWIFWAIQPYISSREKRDSVALSLICSTVPVLLSGFSQSFLNVYGPFKTLWGLIIWYQRNHGSAISSLFSNQNYAGAWLALVLPFAILFVLKKESLKLFRIIATLITFSITFMIVLTSSRSAISSIFVSSSLLFPLNIFKQNFIINSIFVITFFVFFIYLFPELFKNIIETIIPKNLIDKFLIDGSSARIEIWSKAIKFIGMNPIFGLGAGTFPIIYKMYGGINDGQHAHNLFIQLSYDYGLPSSLLIFVPFFFILVNAVKNNFSKTNTLTYEENISNKVWFCSLLIFFIMHSFDVTYFDVRISLLFWIFLSGNQCINSELSNKSNTVKTNN